MALDYTRACYPRITYYFQLEKGSHHLLWTHPPTERRHAVNIFRRNSSAELVNHTQQELQHFKQTKMQPRAPLFPFHGCRSLLLLLRMRSHSYFSTLKARNQTWTLSASAEALCWLTTGLVKQWWGINGCWVQEVGGGWRGACGWIFNGYIIPEHTHRHTRVHTQPVTCPTHCVIRETVLSLKWQKSKP